MKPEGFLFPFVLDVAHPSMPKPKIISEPVPARGFDRCFYLWLKVVTSFFLSSGFGFGYDAT